MLQGKLVRRTGHGVILNVQGVGYGLEVPLSTLRDLTLGEVVVLWVHTRVREDHIKLFGFLSFEEKQTFEVLLQINGVGPKLALAIMSTLDLASLKEAVVQREMGVFREVPGIGEKTAEKILVDLYAKREKLPQAAAVSSLRKIQGFDFKRHDMDHLEKRNEEDLSSALQNLGYKDKEVRYFLSKLSPEDFAMSDFGLLIQKVLNVIRDEKKLAKPLREKTPAQSAGLSDF